MAPFLTCLWSGNPKSPKTRSAALKTLQDFGKVTEKWRIGLAFPIFLVAVILLWGFSISTKEDGGKIWKIRHDYLGLELRIGRGLNHAGEKGKEIFSWISVPLESNQTERFLETVAKRACAFSNTTTIKVPGLENGRTVELPAGKIHRFTIFTYDDAGNARCSGGDYYEADLSGDSWKSRPLVKDLGDGSYSMSFQIHPDFSGEYILKTVLLFRSFQGLILGGDHLVLRQEVLDVRIKFRPDHQLAMPSTRLPACRKQDFQLDNWSGRWTRHGQNHSCKVDGSGRYRCLKPDFPCQPPWCQGPLGSLESNGWVYSSHCSFKIFTGDSAWDCLQNRWFFFWGDSNHVDSIRNLLNFILGMWDVEAVPRRFDRNFTNPANPSQTVRITSIYNGHWKEDQNCLGLKSLENKDYQLLLKSYFVGKTLPDVMVMNSGLHDGTQWRNFTAFRDAAEFAAEFWSQLLGLPEKRKMPEIIFRNTVAPAGESRRMAFNTHRIEVINVILLEKFRQKGLASSVIDNFDLTFPWHFDNNCSDGIHYGRPPNPHGHWYFVDLMLIHVLLNAICLQG